jgi:hypothetical protein
MKKEYRRIRRIAAGENQSPGKNQRAAGEMNGLFAKGSRL